MKKSIIAVLAAAILVAVVICTAGCVSTPDPIVGDWVAEDDTSVSFVTFAEDNSGYFIVAAEKEGAAGSAAATFDWIATEPRKTFSLTFGDGTIKTATLEATRGVMTIDGVEFEKMSSAISGAQVAQYERVKAELKRAVLRDGMRAALLEELEKKKQEWAAY